MFGWGVKHAVTDRARIAPNRWLKINRGIDLVAESGQKSRQKTEKNFRGLRALSRENLSNLFGDG